MSLQWAMEIIKQPATMFLSPGCLTNYEKSPEQGTLWLATMIYRGLPILPREMSASNHQRSTEGVYAINRCGPEAYKIYWECNKACCKLSNSRHSSIDHCFPEMSFRLFILKGKDLNVVEFNFLEMCSRLNQQERIVVIRYKTPIE